MNPFLIFETENFEVSQTSDYLVPGYIIIMNKQGITRLSDFNEGQKLDLMQCIDRAESLVEQIINPPRIYIMKFAEVNETVHFHVFPRTEQTGESFATKTNNAAPYNGALLVDWVWKNNSLLGFSTDDCLEFVESAKKLL